MEKILLTLCFKSCLRGENDNEYYEILGFESSKGATPEAIKKSFKKKSLELHPVNETLPSNHPNIARSYIIIITKLICHL